MQSEINAGTVLIKDETLLPVQLQFENETGLPGWKVVAGMTARELDWKIRKAGWTFFSLSGNAKATAFGVDRANMLRRAIAGILEGAKGNRFNSLEILEVAFAGSGRFPLVQHLKLSAQWRHIERSVIASMACKISNTDERRGSKQRRAQAGKRILEASAA